MCRFIAYGPVAAVLAALSACTAPAPVEPTRPVPSAPSPLASVPAAPASATTSAPVAPPATPKPWLQEGTNAWFDGDRLITNRLGVVQARSLTDPHSPTELVAALPGCSISVSGNTILLVCPADNPTAEKLAALQKLDQDYNLFSFRRSDDGGKSWQTAELAGLELFRAGPQVWVSGSSAIIGGACPLPLTAPCNLGMRLHSGTEFREPRVAGGAPIPISVEVNAATRSIYVLGMENPQQRLKKLSSAKDREERKERCGGGGETMCGMGLYAPFGIYVSRDDGGSFVRTELPLGPISSPDLTAHFFDGQVVLDPSGRMAAVSISRWSVGRPECGYYFQVNTPDDGKTWALADSPPANSIKFARGRGYAWAYPDKGWESLDAGNTWRSIAGPAKEAKACGEKGCLLADAQLRAWGSEPTTPWVAAESPAELQKDAPDRMLCGP